MAFLFPPPPLMLTPSVPSPPPSSLPPCFSNRRRYSVAFSIPNPFSLKHRSVEFHSVNTIGRRKLPEKIIDQYFFPLKNRRISLKEVQDAVNSINAWLMDNDYVCSQVILSKSPLLSNGALTLLCMEPLLSAVELVAVDGDGNSDPNHLLLTRTGTICNALGLHPGDVFVWRASGFARLMALGLFEFVNAEVKAESDDRVTLVLKLRERATGRIEPGAGITSDGRVYGDISIVDNNFMGRAQRLRLEWQKRLDVPRAAGGFAFEDMRVGAYIPLSFRLRVYRDSNAAQRVPDGNEAAQQSDGEQESADTNGSTSDSAVRYEKDRDGILFDLGYRPHDTHVLFNLSPMFERIYPNSAESNGSASIQAALQTGFTHATRRPVELPRAGHIFRIEHLFGTPLRVSPNLFHRVKLKLTNYFGIAAKSSIAARFIIGVGSDNLPWHEQRSLGGQTTVRGYSYGHLGRYKTYGIGRVELRVPLAFLREDHSEPNPKKRGGSNATDRGDSTDAERSNTDANEQVQQNEKGEIKMNRNMLPTGLFDRLPALVGVLFGDMAVADTRKPELVGASYGLGLRIGGIIAVDWTSTMNGIGSRIHFSLVDQNL